MHMFFDKLRQHCPQSSWNVFTSLYLLFKPYRLNGFSMYGSCVAWPQSLQWVVAVCFVKWCCFLLWERRKLLHSKYPVVWDHAKLSHSLLKPLALNTVVSSDSYSSSIFIYVKALCKLFIFFSITYLHDAFQSFCWKYCPRLLFSAIDKKCS